MIKTFIIVSVSDRVQELNALVDSIIALGFDDYRIALYLQDPEGRAGEIRNRERYSQIIVVPEKEGCHAARVHLLRKVKSDIYINLDDDMLLTKYTRYDAAQSARYSAANSATPEKNYNLGITLYDYGL